MMEEMDLPNWYNDCAVHGSVLAFCGMSEGRTAHAAATIMPMRSLIVRWLAVIGGEGDFPLLNC